VINHFFMVTKFLKNTVFFICIGLLFSCGNRPIQNTVAGKRNVDSTFDLRVLSYNIHHANPPSRPGVIDLDAIAGVIKKQQPHLVALQEVDVFTERSGKSLHQAEKLAEMTGMTAYFAKAIDYGWGEYGVAILSKFPMDAMKNTSLPTAKETNGEPRALATVVVTLPEGKKILFACTHLDAQRQDTNRLLQINSIVNILKTEKLPVIIAGDFNSVPGTTVINTLDSYFTRTCITNCGFTIPQINPTKTIDFIAYTASDAFTVTEHYVPDEKYASDHLPVGSVLRIK
jgi:endonuclease/exonuclease/phosphatase family metal-dependent hydrolase